MGPSNVVAVGTVVLCLWLIVALAIVVGVAVATARRARRLMPENALPAGIAATPPVIRGFDLIRRTDPDFDERAFYDRVSWLFAQLHRALSERDLGPIRDYTDDGALRTLSSRLARFERDGQVQTFGDPRIDSIGAVAVSHSDGMQTVTVHVSATAAVSVVDTASGELVLPDLLGDGVTRRPLVETWILTRPAGAGAVPPVGDRCPFCGAPLAGGSSACPHCGTDLRGPERQWTILRWEMD